MRIERVRLIISITNFRHLVGNRNCSNRQRKGGGKGSTAAGNEK